MNAWGTLATREIKEGGVLDISRVGLVAIRKEEALQLVEQVGYGLTGQ